MATLRTTEQTSSVGSENSTSMATGVTGTEWWHPKEKPQNTPLVAADPRQARADAIADALRILQARGEEVVPLDSVLRDLNGTVTEDELWNELEEKRLEDLKARQEVKERTRQKGRIIGTGVAFVCLTATAFAARSIIANYNDWREEQQQQMAKVAEQKIQAALPPAPPPKQVVQTVTTHLLRQTPTLKRLDSLKEGQEFRTDLSTIGEVRRLVGGAGTMAGLPKSEWGNLLLETNPSLQNGTWQVVHRGGKLYVRAWTFGRIPTPPPDIAAPPDPRTPPNYAAQQQARRDAERTFYNSREAALDRTFTATYRNGGNVPASVPTEPLIQVTLSDDAFSGYSSTGSGAKAMLRTTVMHTDKHTYEAWKQVPFPKDAQNGGTYTQSGGM